MEATQNTGGLTPAQQTRLDEKNRQLAEWLARCEHPPEVVSRIRSLQAIYARIGWGIEIQEKEGRLIVAFYNCKNSSNRPIASAFLDEL